MAPQRYVARARLTKAQHLLESSNASLTVIARDCGYPSPDALRYAFSRALRVTPTEYRRRFGTRAAASPG